MIRLRIILICCLYGIGIFSAQAQVPVPDFSASTVSGCGPLSVNFKDLSTGAPIYWSWDFGNGQISRLQNPGTTYATPGTYKVTLIVTNKNGSNSIQKTDYITVFPSPSANFNADLSLACAPANIRFTDLSVSGQGTITQRAWDFGDGTTSPLQDPSHIYSATGYYTVSLKVTNSGGCSSTATKARYIRIVQGVQPNFEYSQVSNSCTAPYQLNFINQTAGPGNLTYSWDLGNGITTTQEDPTASYPVDKNYTVILKATSDLGCSGTAQKVLPFSASSAVITAPDNACINTPVNFANGSTPIPASAVWDFGDGTISADPPPAKTYTAAATYTVKVVNTYSSCKDSITKTIQIANDPVVSFTANQTNSCQAPFDVTFTDNTLGATGWLWDFGDGGTSNAKDPPHTYNTTGNFDVTLTVTTGSGCTGTRTISKMIKVQTPTVALSGNSILGACVKGTPTNSTVRPVASINAVDGVPSTGYQWSAPGATLTTSTLANPSFTYATAGTYPISLTITTNGGCHASGTFNNAVHIGTPTTPVIQAAPNPTCGRDPITFTSTALPADHWAWNFGDGSPVAIGTPVTHSYDNFKDYIVSLTLTNAGCPQTTTTPVHVNPPIAGFTFAPDCANRFQVKFVDTSKIDPALSVNYQWDFGDPSIPPFTGKIPPLATYPHPGIYNVSLTVTNGTCSNTATVPVNLNPPAALFSNPPSTCRNRSFTLQSTSTNASQIATYSWQIDANTPDATTPVITTSPTYTASISKIGPHTITLLITDIYHCPSPAATGSITVTGPTAAFTPVATGAVPGGCKNSPIAFTDQSVPYAGTTITTWTWDFEDGTVTNLTAPYSHSYADTGFYTVKLAVTDNATCSDTVIGTIPIQITSPQPLFAALDTLYCPNVPLAFQDSSKGYNLTYSWDFGDGSPAENVPTPSHPFPNNGQRYSVKLTVTDQTGCSDILTRSDYIHIQKPIADFTLEDSTTICPPLETKFTPNGQYYDSLYWDFGDGSTSTLPNTSHFFNTPDTFDVKLFLQGHGGCLDSATHRVFVLNPQTSTTFTYSPLQHCDSITTDFTIVPPGYTRFTLTFGDGAADSSLNTAPSHQYRLPAIYSPQLVLEDSTGCIVSLASTSGSIKVLGATPFFSMNTHAFCDTGTVYFTDVSFSNDGILSKTWDFGDGTSATQLNDPSGFNASHHYAVPGEKVIKIKVATQNCEETYADTLKVYQTPHPIITAPSPLCINIPLQFQGSLITPEDPVDTVNWAWNAGNEQTSAEQNPPFSYSQAGPYTVSLRTFVSFGCSDTASLPVTINPSPSIKGPSEITTPVGFPVTIPFTYSSNVINYSWTPAANLSCIDCPDPIASPTFSTLYIVTVNDSNNCISSDSVLVKTVCNGKNYFIPNTFSPNNDGVNDVFYPRGDNLYNIQSMRIFNRWGQMVFERRNFLANTASEGWNGTVNGHPAPSDAYVYIIEVICNNAQTVALKGDITLLR